MNYRPLVSVVINNYNYGHFLSESIESALGQTYDNVEVIVVDDGSTDNSREVIRTYGNRIRTVLKENGGQSTALNAGFAASTGDIVCFLDSDDAFYPSKVEKIAACFSQSPEYGWCFHLLERIDSRSGHNYPLQNVSAFGEWDIRTEVLNGKLPFISTATSGMCFRRALLVELFPMSEAMRIAHDNYLKMSALALSKGYFLGERLARQGIHSDNAYTFRRNKRLTARTDISIAMSLGRFPGLAKLTKGHVISGLGEFWSSGGMDAECSMAVRSYLYSLTWMRRLEIVARAFIRSLRLKCGLITDDCGT